MCSRKSTNTGMEYWTGMTFDPKHPLSHTHTHTILEVLGVDTGMEYQTIITFDPKHPFFATLALSHKTLPS